MMKAYLTTRCTDEDVSCTPGISYVSKVDILMSVTKSAGIIFSFYYLGMPFVCTQYLSSEHLRSLRCVNLAINVLNSCLQGKSNE